MLVRQDEHDGDHSAIQDVENSPISPEVPDVRLDIL
jgi:hypothetical protein